MKKSLSFLAVLLLLAAVPPDPSLEQARKASKTLIQDLQTVLKATLESQGPAAAIPICSQVAPTLAQEISKAHQVQIRRISLNHRNPANLPDAYERKLLEKWAKNPKEIPEEHVERVTLANKQVLRYLKPLYIQPTCLQCHGSSAQIKPEVKVLLKQHYPKDLATGYQTGDFRGAVTVIVPLK